MGEKAMKIELLYFDGCPNHVQAFENLKECLRELALEAQVERIKVKSNDDAIMRHFLGSPSIRINGKDLETDEDETTEYSMRCRRYSIESSWQGFPPKELLRAALKREMERQKT